MGGGGTFVSLSCLDVFYSGNKSINIFHDELVYLKRVCKSLTRRQIAILSVPHSMSLQAFVPLPDSLHQCHALSSVRRIAVG